MRKLLAALIAITLISIPVSAEAAIKPGSTCPTISKTATVGKVSYTCAKQGTRKVWLQTIRVGAPCKKAGVSAIVLKKKYLCTAKGKSRTWSLIKIADANQPSKTSAPSLVEASINIIYDEVSSKNNIPVTIERIDPVGTSAVKSFKRELTKSASLTSLLPGRYELTLGIQKIDVAQGSYLGMLSSSVILLSKGESRSAEVNFSTLMPKSTHAVSKTDYTEFKELSDGAIQFKSASLSNQDIKVNEYLILPPSSELESGYIGKVVSKSADAFLLNPASYFDAIPQGSFHSVIDLGSDDYTFQPTFEAGNIKGNLKSKTQAESKVVKDFVVKALKCSIDKGVEKTLKVEPNIQIENDFVWPSSNPTYSLGIRAGVDINIGKTAGASISCSAEVAANNIPIPLSACPKCLQVDVNIRLSGSASIVGKTGAISIPIYLSGGVHAPLTGAPSFYKLTELSSSVTPGIINGSLEATLAGSINLHTPKNVIVLSGEVGVAFTKSLNMSLSKCTVSRETQSSFRLTGKIGLTAKIDAVVLEVSKSVSLEASVKKDFNKTIDSFNVLTQFCENAPSPSPTPTAKPAVTLNTSYFPFSGNFRVSGNGQAADLYFNLTGGRQITIFGSVPRDTSEGTLTIYYAEGTSRTFMQSYEIGMGVHSHSFMPKKDGVYEFKIYFNSSAGKTRPDLIFISIS
jgi:hypothetical protein